MSTDHPQRPRPCRLGAWLGVVLVLVLCEAQAEPLTLRAATMLVSDAATPPPDSAPWRSTTLPDNWQRTQPGLTGVTSWYRVPFELPAVAAEQASFAIYLPYFYDGAQLWLNGVPLARIRGSDTHWRVLWARPHLMTVPEGLVQPGGNVLALRATLPLPQLPLRFPAVTVGELDDLLPLYERRLFWIRTMPQFTVTNCALMSCLVLLVWLRRRRQEVLYGLLGLAAMLWGMRTLSLVIEQMPASQWTAWRVVYWGSTGGFAVVLALFAQRFAGMRRLALERALAVYAFIGPAVLALGGLRAEVWVGTFWGGGLLVVCALALGSVALAAWRQRTWQAVLLLATIALVFAAGLHDYLVVANVPWLQRLAPEWVGHRVYLLHLAADMLLLVMAAILTARFVQSLYEVEHLNQTLEARVAQRERQLADNFEAMAQMERRRATEEERHRIMLDMHDGLGSQLFTSLSRVERGAMAQAEVAALLRRCIEEMRLALDTLAPEDGDFRTVLGNFRYRWQALLDAAGVQSSWSVEPSDGPLAVAPHQQLHLLRVLQEALTNVVKHAQARAVQVHVAQQASDLVVEVRDDGRGPPGGGAHAGHGLRNMHSRAQRLGAQLTIAPTHPGTRVTLLLAGGGSP